MIHDILLKSKYKFINISEVVLILQFKEVEI